MAAGGKERQLTKTSERNYSKLISVFLWGCREAYTVFLASDWLNIWVSINL